MEDIWNEIITCKRAGDACAVATIVQVKGSTPRSVGAKMLIKKDGTFIGTVGGGCLEAEVWQHGMRVIKTKRTALLDFDLTGRDGASEGLICGGTLRIFIEPVLPNG